MIPSTVQAVIAEKGKRSICFILFISCLRCTLMTFGGGMAFMLQKPIVDQHRLLSMEEFLDFVTIARSGPGAFMINFVSAVGYRLAGIAGIIAAVAGVVLPTILLVVLLVLFLGKYLDEPVAQKAYAAIRPAVAGLVLALWAEMAGAVLRRRLLNWIFFAGAVLMLLFLKWHPLVVILLAALIGYFSYVNKARHKEV